MKPAPFRLHRPTTVAEATAVFAEHGDEAKVLAGGQSLVPLLASSPHVFFEHLVDLNGVTALRGIEREDGVLRVGAMVRQAEAERSDDVATSVPLLHRALPHIGHFQIRNRGHGRRLHRARRSGIRTAGGGSRRSTPRWR